MLRSTFDPTPRVEITTFETTGFKIGVLRVWQHPSRPVIATKNSGNLVKEGDIFFRYPGQSSRIKYSDLRALLDQRDTQARAKVLPLLQKILTLGPENALIADLSNGEFGDGEKAIVIHNDLIERLKFVKQGQFKHTDGEPTLRLVGDVRPIDAVAEKFVKGYVSPNELLVEFFEQHTPHDPKEYIRCAIEGSNTVWLPIHYFARAGGLSSEGLAKFISQTDATEIRKNGYKTRALGESLAYRAAPATGSTAKFLSELLDGKAPNPTNVRSAFHVGAAIIALKRKPNIEVNQLLRTLKDIMEIARQKKKTTLMSTLRRAAARIDELYFGLVNTEVD